MPANLTPQYKEAEDRFRAAETTAEKISALEEMMRVIPKHKGTEKLQADIKRKISKFREEGKKPGGQGQRGVEYNVEREGGGQIVLVGPPNSGKSTLLSTLTKARPEVGPYPFTTHKPLPGMLEFEDIKFQVVDLPPVSEEFSEPWLFAIMRNADAALLVLDAGSGDVLDDLETLLRVAESYRVVFYGWDRPAPEIDGPGTPVKCILVANKMDQPDSADNLVVLEDLYGDRFPIMPVSWVSEQRVDSLKEAVFRMLDVVRVYTKIPGKPADMKSPYVVPRGTTVIELASTIHKDLAGSLRFARVWGVGQFDGQMVSRDHVLSDRDVIELHA